MTEKLLSRWITIGIVLVLAAWALRVNWPLNLGIDLRGGTVITYRIDRESLEEVRDQGDSYQDAVSQTVQVMATRINALGLKDISVRQEGLDRIVITAAATSEEEQAAITDQITQLGDLKFLMGVGTLRGPKVGTQTFDVWDPDAQGYRKIPFNEEEAEAQRKQAIEAGEAVPGTPYVLKDEEGRELPFVWYPWNPGQLARDQDGSASAYEAAMRKARLGQEYDEDLVQGGWTYFDPHFWGPDRPGFTGQDIMNVGRSRDNLGRPAVSYEVRTERQSEFADYTGKYVDKPMVVVLNNEIWSSASIKEELRDNVQISGGTGGFSQEDQDWLVTALQSGSLKLRPVLESQEDIGAALGDSAVNKGQLATIMGLILVVVFIIVYYRAGGVVATVALVTNLALLMAVLALFRATVTLPGIAGIILTIGMSVDANILIFERVREELAKGKTLVAAMQAGYGRAFVTIVDANLTTLITAVFLYQYGVGPIKGFAVTLMAGIVCSLFTAVYLTKSIYGLLLRKGWLRTFRMGTLVPPNVRIGFVQKNRVALTGSLVALALAVAVFETTPDQKAYGLDFTGGTIVRVHLAEGTYLSTDDISRKVASITDPEGSPKYGEVEAIGVITGEGSRKGDTFNTFDLKLQDTGDISSEEVTRLTQEALGGALGEDLKSVEAARPAADDDAWTVTFQTRELLASELRAHLDRYETPRGRSIFHGLAITPLNGREDPELGGELATRWEIEISPATFSSENLLTDLRRALEGDLPPKGTQAQHETFPKLSYVGPNVVADLKQSAMVSIVLSLLATVLYIWFRFKELKYGLGAVVAVFHDVLIVLGVVVLVNSLGLVHVPINLSIIGAFLTIIGYSLNDTIVLFDRVRENLGNITGSFSEVINTSINQTLARTLLTSLTTFLVVTVLFVVNYGERSILEGFSFTLMVGVIVGTYSSIFVASPVIIWLQNRTEKRRLAASKS